MLSEHTSVCVCVRSVFTLLMCSPREEDTNRKERPKRQAVRKACWF